MDAEEIRAGMAAVAAEHGPWHSHNIHLGEGVWTLSETESVENGRLRRYLQATADAAGGSLAGLRVLDLACEEGAFGIEAARQGAEVVAIEGREANVARARFAAEALGLESYRVEQGDIREVTADSHGEFDIVLSIGILYHLDAPALFEHVRDLRGLARRLLFLSTHVSRVPEASREFGGSTYRGSVVEEHPPDSDASAKEANLRASLDNPESFWLTPASLFNLLADSGFSSILEVRMPRERRELEPGSQANLIALSGERLNVPAPDAPQDEPARWPDRGSEPVHPAQSWRSRARRFLR